MDYTSGNFSTPEIQASQFYIHKSYVNTYYHVYKFLEKWLSENVFRQDSSRVFLASDGYAFRRRFELTDMSKDYETLDFSSLNLPFANYWPQNSGWTPDNRVAAKSAALTYIGVYEGATKIRAAQDTLSIPVTFWFDREDDARMAYEILHFKSFNEHYHSTKVPYGNNTTITGEGSSEYSSILDLPVNIRIDDLQFNPEFKETDWLKKQRVFVIKANFTMRSYAILPPDQPKYDIYMRPDGSLSDGSRYEDGMNYYHIVDDAILNFNRSGTNVLTYDAGYNDVTGECSGSRPFPEEGSVGKVYVDSYKSSTGTVGSPKIYVWDPVNLKYVRPDYNCDYTSIRSDGTYEEPFVDVKRFICNDYVTKTSNTLVWEYGESLTSDDLSSIELHITGRGDVVSIPTGNMSYELTGLTPGSRYYGYIVFITKTGVSKRYVVNFETLESPADVKAPDNSLVGVSW